MKAAMLSSASVGSHRKQFKTVEQQGSLYVRSCLHGQQKRQLLQQATAVTLPMAGSSPVMSGVAGRQGPLATCWVGQSAHGLQDIVYN